MRFSSVFLLSLAALGGAPASAQTEAESNILGRLIATACIDVVPMQTGCETIVLLRSEEEPEAADLLIYSEPGFATPREPLAIARAVAFAGVWRGQTPSLAEGAEGTLLLHEEQVSIGRTPWTQTLTISHSHAGFSVTGLSYSTYDRAVGGGFSCDIDYTTGQWRMSADRPNPETGETVYDVSDRGQTALSVVPLAEWSWSRGLPSLCADPLSAWFQTDVR